MNDNEKALARTKFQNKIYKSDGQSFEDLFVQIMSYNHEYFQPIKAWGNIGDRKNDGYIRNKGIYFQVYAPEDIRKNYLDVVKKLEVDFIGLKKYWNSVNEFYFVLNDKYKGVNPDCERALQKLKVAHGLKDAGFLIAKDLENILFSLKDDQILSIIGSIPNPLDIKRLDFSVLNDVIEHIMKLPLKGNNEYNIELPDLDDKILFNNLSNSIGNLLKSGYIQVPELEKYLSNNGDFLSDSLRDKLSAVYNEKKVFSFGDNLFWNIVECLSPRDTQSYQTAVIVIMSKYFETCDIFEEPSSEE